MPGASPPEETVAWLLSLEPDERKKALGGIYTNSLGGNTDTKGWLDLYLRLPHEEVPNFARINMYLGQQLRNPAATLAWFEEVALSNQFPVGEDESWSRNMFFDSARNLGNGLSPPVWNPPWLAPVRFRMKTSDTPSLLELVQTWPPSAWRPPANSFPNEARKVLEALELPEDVCAQLLGKLED